MHTEEMTDLVQLVKRNSSNSAWNIKGVPSSFLIGVEFRSICPLLRRECAVVNNTVTVTWLQGKQSGHCVTVSVEEFSEIIAKSFVMNPNFKLNWTRFRDGLAPVQSTLRVVELQAPWGVGGSYAIT